MNTAITAYIRIYTAYVWINATYNIYLEMLRFDTTEIAAALLHGSRLLASFPIFYDADDAITEFWQQLFDVVPIL